MSIFDDPDYRAEYERVKRRFHADSWDTLHRQNDDYRAMGYVFADVRSHHRRKEHRGE